MIALVLVALKSLLIAAAALFLLRLMRARSAAERATIAHVGLLALLLLPLAALALPELALPLPVRDVVAEPMAKFESTGRFEPVVAHLASVAPMGQGADPSVVPTPVLVTIALYLIPALMLVAATFAALLRLIGLRARAEILVDANWLNALARAQHRIGFKSGTALLKSDDVGSPVSWGLARPTILLDETTVLAPGQAEPIIAHELAHLVHLDWLKLILARLATAVFWFNPLVWALAREAHQLREEAADDAVIAADVAGPDYAELLIGAARDRNRGGMPGAVHGIAAPRNSLRRRIQRVLDSELTRAQPAKTWTAGCVVAMLGVGAPLAAMAITPEAGAAPTPAATDTGSGTIIPPRAIPVPSSAVARQTADQSAERIIASARAVKDQHRVVAVERVVPASEDDRIDADLLVQMLGAGVTLAYKRAMADAGFPDLAVNQLAGFHTAGVTPDYARAMRAAGMPATWNDLSSAHGLGLKPGYIATMRVLGIAGSFADFRTLWTLGITPEAVRRLRARGVVVSTPRQLVELQAMGADRKS